MSYAVKTIREAEVASRPKARPLIDHIGPPSPAQARRLLALLGLAGDLPYMAPAARTNPSRKAA